MNDLISRQQAIDALERKKDKNAKGDVGGFYNKIIQNDIDTLIQLPSAQPEIILCKDCKHWIQSMGKMKGYGLGRCDFHDADLVTCNGYCYWAERRADGTQRRHILAK